jgi:hypothetical protein
MSGELARYWSLVVAIAGMLSVLLRVAYLLGQILGAFRKHIKDSESSHADYESRLRRLEQGRHR